MRGEGYPTAESVSHSVAHCVANVYVHVHVQLGTGCVWEELVPSKIFNPPFPVLKAGHSVSYSYICDVCLEWVKGLFG